MIYEPRSYQTAMRDFVLDRRRCNLYAGMGTGKTSSTCSALVASGLTTDAPALVLAPKRVAIGVWPQEVTKFYESFGSLEMQVITGSHKQRIDALKNSNANVFTTNYEQIPWLVEVLGDKWPFKVIVADEASKLRNLRLDVRRKKDGSEFFRISGGSKRAGAIAKVAHKHVTHWVNLSGTPCPNGLEGLWGSNWFVDRGQRLSRTYTAFIDRWFDRVLPHPGSMYPEIKPKPHAQSEIESLLADVTLTIKAEDWFDLPPLIENEIQIVLPAKVRHQYRDMERKFFAEINGHQIEAISAASKSMKLLQLANGAAYTDDKGTWTEVHDAKIKALEDIIEESAGMPILVAYHFKSDLARLKSAFPFAVELKNDPAIIADFNAGRIRLLLAHPASAGHGLNLQHGTNILVFFSVNWNLENHLQIIERVGPTRQAQSGYKRPVYVHYLLAEGTIDNDVLFALRHKTTIQDALLNAMKRRSYER